MIFWGIRTTVQALGNKVSVFLVLTGYTGDDDSSDILLITQKNST